MKRLKDLTDQQVFKFSTGGVRWTLQSLDRVNKTAIVTSVNGKTETRSWNTKCYPVPKEGSLT